MLDTGAHLSALLADSQAVADLAEASLDQQVPACPDWRVGDLIGHLGGVYSWVCLVMQAGDQKPDRPRDRAPQDRSEVVDWFREERTAVNGALEAKEPWLPAWSFVGPRDVGWWRRRQAMETAVHLYDVQAAAGRPGPVATELAADGVDELLTEFLAFFLGMRPVERFQGTLHLHCTDADGEWLVDFTGPAVEIRREHARADTAVRGPASDLFLWGWNRLPLATPTLEVFGSKEVAEALAEVRI